MDVKRVRCGELSAYWDQEPFATVTTQDQGKKKKICVDNTVLWVLAHPTKIKFQIYL